MWPNKNISHDVASINTNTGDYHIDSRQHRKSAKISQNTQPQHTLHVFCKQAGEENAVKYLGITKEKQIGRKYSHDVTSRKNTHR